VRVDLDCPFTFAMELGVLPPGAGANGAADGGDRSRGEPAGERAGFAPIHHEDVTADLADLVEEAFVRGVLADRIAPGPGPVRVRVRPEWVVEPVVQRIRVAVRPAGSACEHEVAFRRGRWTRRLPATLRRLRERNLLGDEREKVYLRLVARRDGPPDGGGASALDAPAALGALRERTLEAPEFCEETLADAGVRALGDGELDPDRPVLVNQRAVDEILERTVEAGPSEIGGGMLGKIVRLPEPIPGTRTRFVTVLSAGLPDRRHEGDVGRLTFSPEALIEAARIADLRGLRETVCSCYHSHGWGKGCDECNQSAGCALPSVDVVSDDDYEVLECLFPSKATLMPIAGRKLGAPGKRPVLEIHAWSGGAMRPVAWRRYDD